MRFTVTGTHLGAFQGIEATGRRVTISEFTLYRLEDGKFAEVWTSRRWARSCGRSGRARHRAAELGKYSSVLATDI